VAVPGNPAGGSAERLPVQHSRSRYAVRRIPWAQRQRGLPLSEETAHGVAHSRFDRSRQIAAMCYQRGRKTSKPHARRHGLPTAGRLQHRHQPIRRRKGAPRRGRLWVILDRAPAGRDSVVGDGHRFASQVDIESTQTGDLAPPQTGQRQLPHVRRRSSAIAARIFFTVRARVCQCDTEDGGDHSDGLEHGIRLARRLNPGTERSFGGQCPMPAACRSRAQTPTGRRVGSPHPRW